MKKLKDFKTKRALKKKVIELEEDIKYFQKITSELEDTLNAVISDLEHWKREYQKLLNCKGMSSFYENQEDIKEAV